MLKAFAVDKIRILETVHPQTRSGEEFLGFCHDTLKMLDVCLKFDLQFVCDIKLHIVSNVLT